MSSKQRHWETIYRTKAEDELSWHQGVPTLSLRLILGVADRNSRIIDVGGGTSTLASRLAENSRRSVTVIDIADEVIQSIQSGSGVAVRGVHRVRADLTRVEKLGTFDIWHDRAVFHFMTEPIERRAYVDLARRTLRIGGYAILSTFALDGPATCSGLAVERYNAAKLAAEFSKGFALVRRVREIHTTPWGTTQPFEYVILRRVRAGRAGTGGSPTSARGDGGAHQGKITRLPAEAAQSTKAGGGRDTRVGQSGNNFGSDG
jgi:2-polyprenyl-3-methyl-5-hydroxy-6-metoxy-1,4-benzoquinol methylase